MPEIENIIVKIYTHEDRIDFEKANEPNKLGMLMNIRRKIVTVVQSIKMREKHEFYMKNIRPYEYDGQFD